MIDEAIGKILGMAMAYVASAAGLFVAYVNYRKRIVKADKVMTPAAWATIAIVVVALAAGVLVVGSLATERAEPAAVEIAEAPPPEVEAPPPVPSEPEPRQQWSWLGVLLPASIFLFATVVTASLHRRFSTHGH